MHGVDREVLDIKAHHNVLAARPATPAVRQQTADEVVVRRTDLAAAEDSAHVLVAVRRVDVGCAAARIVNLHVEGIAATDVDRSREPGFLRQGRSLVVGAEGVDGGGDAGVAAAGHGSVQGPRPRVARDDGLGGLSACGDGSGIDVGGVRDGSGLDHVVGEGRASRIRDQGGGLGLAVGKRTGPAALGLRLVGGLHARAGGPVSWALQRSNSEQLKKMRKARRRSNLPFQHRNRSQWRR
jgi:hypothetical protein